MTKIGTSICVLFCLIGLFYGTAGEALRSPVLVYSTEDVSWLVHGIFILMGILILRSLSMADGRKRALVERGLLVESNKSFFVIGKPVRHHLP